jgi:hemolysin activation/secretion protein
MITPVCCGLPRPLHVSRLALALALSLPTWVSAQIVPNAGSALRESTPPERVIPPTPDVAPLPAAPLAPAVSAPAGASFMLKSVRFNGATVFPAEELQSVAAAQIGRQVTLADLQAIAQRVTEKYRRAGYALAQALVPAQDVTDGNVEISVLEGVLGRIRLQVDPATPIDPQFIERIASRLGTGRPLHGATLERVMLLLSDLPGVEAQAALEPGDEVGSTDLILSIGPRRRWDLTVDADNFGSRVTSEYRVGMLGRVNSPLRLGDNLDARAQVGFGGRLAYGRIGYELPVGADGTRIGAAYSRVDYELGREFAVLDGNGQADVFEVSVLHPFIRSRARNLFGRLGWQRKDLTDRLDLVDERSDKTIRLAYAGLAYEQRDAWLGGGYSSAGLTAYFGKLELDADTRTADRAARGTAGHFQHWNYSLSRLNALTSNSSVFFGVSGQFADNNLDSAERVALGGPRAVRAYATSEATVDEGHVANLELRYSINQALSVQGFYDWGWGRFSRKPAVGEGDNHVALRGYGVGAFWGGQDGLALRASLAWRVTERGETDSDRVPRLYVQVSKSF